MSRQPMIVNNGQLIEDGYGDPTLLFNHSYLQIPIAEQVNYGIRICLELQMLNTLQQGFIFVYGNRHQKNISLSCEHNLKFLIFKTFSQNRTSLNKTIKSNLKCAFNDFRQSNQKAIRLELCSKRYVSSHYFRGGCSLSPLGPGHPCYG
jgi:hypothetical protein